MTIGERIRHYREERRLSLTQLSSSCGIRQESLTRWEQDYLQPNSQNLVKLSAALGVPVDWLLGTKGKYTKYNLDLSIGEKVLLKRGLRTRKQFISDCCITMPALAAIENGKIKTLHASTLIDLSTITGMSVDWLLGIRRK